MEDSIKQRNIRDYQIIDQLGKGSYGVVYTANKKSNMIITTDDTQVYVLKQIPLLGLDKEQLDEANREASIMASLNVPYLVKYLESFVENNRLNIIMEYCDGGDLAKYLKQNKATGKFLKEDKVWNFFIQICVGISFIHKKNILHRDLKTMNIFLTKDDKVRIGDLGVAKKLNSENSFAHTFVGTPYYISPEMCEEKPYNEKSDIWSLGCILYEMLTYNHPFNAKNPAALCLKILTSKYDPIPKDYSSDMKKVLELLLEKDYLKRPRIFEILKNQMIISKAKRLNIELYDVAFSPFKSINHGDSSLDLKKSILSTAVETKSNSKQPIEIKIKLDKHMKRKSTDDLSTVNLESNVEEIEKQGKKGNIIINKSELPLKGLMIAPDNYNSNGSGNAIGVNSQRGTNVVSINYERKNPKIKNGVSNNQSKSRVETKSPQEKILKMLEKKTPIKIKNDSKQTSTKDNLINKGKSSEVDLKINHKPNNTPLKTTNNFDCKPSINRVTTPQLKSNADVKLKVTKNGYGICAKQINLNLNHKESPRVINNYISKQESKSSSRNINENDLLFLKKLLPKNDYEKLILANNSQNGMIASIIKDKYMETISKNKLGIHSFEHELKDSEIYKELYGNISEFLKSFDCNISEKKGSINTNKSITPQSNIDISKSISIENLSKIKSMSSNKNMEVTKSISTDKISNKKKDFVEDDNFIPLCFNRNGNDFNNDFNQVCYVNQNESADDININQEYFSSKNSTSKEDSTEEITVHDMNKEEVMHIQNSRDNENESVVIVHQSKSENFNKSLTSQNEELPKRKQEFITKIESLKKRCIKIISEEKFNMIYQQYANNSKNNNALVEDDVNKLESLISGELSEAKVTIFMQCLCQLLYYELQLSNIEKELSK